MMSEISIHLQLENRRNYLRQQLQGFLPSFIILTFCAVVLSYILLLSYLTMPNNSTDTEVVPESRINLGEGPFWDVETNSLYYVDIYAGTIFRYDDNEKKLYSCKIEGENMVSFVIPVNKKNEFVIGAGRKVALIKWDGKATKAKIECILFEVEDDKPNNRFNDAKCDPRGRLFAGTMRLEILEGNIFDYREGNLYRYSNDSGLVTVKDDVGISNGLDWNKNSGKMYYVDSVDMNIIEYDYDEATGDIDKKSKREVIHFDGTDVVPDGMTLDENGNIYIAMHGQGQVLVIEPQEGKIIKTIDFPARLVTSCAFGGPELDILFVTSAHKGKESELGGSLYIVRDLDVKGVPMNKFHLY